MTVASARALRWAGAVLILLGGSVHLQQWLRIFRHQSIGWTFLANVIVSVIIGAALLASDDRRLALAGIVLTAASVVAILISRSVGLLGFKAVGYGRPGLEALALEVLALLVLAASLIPAGAISNRRTDTA